MSDSESLPDLGEPESEDAIKAAVAERAQLAAALYLLAFLTCLIGAWMPSWWRLIAGSTVVFCLLFIARIVTLFAALRRVQLFYGHSPYVLKRHRLLNAVGVLLLAYAFLAVWARWPLPALAVFVASIINFVHYASYRGALMAVRRVPPGQG